MSTSLSVLIVEDVESDAQLLVRLLKKTGHEVFFEQVNTAKQMSIALKGRIWDVVISNYSLSQFDGRAALELLKETGQDIPFIVISGAFTEETAAELMMAGAHDYLIKGNLTRLAPAVERELNQAKIRRKHRQAEEALRESEQRYKMVSELVSDYSYKLGVAADGKISLDFVTDSFYSITGRSIEQARTLESWGDIFHPDDLGKAMEFLQGLIATRQAGGLECRTYIGNKQMRWVEITARPEWDVRESRVTAIIGAVKDITARKKAEENLLNSEARLRRAELASKSGNWELHLDSHLMIASEGAAKLYGVDQDQFGYAYVKQIPLPEYRPLLDAALKNLMENNEPYDIEFKIKTVDTGEIKDIHSIAIFDKEKSTLFGIIQDITTRKQAEEALKESEERYRSLFDRTLDGMYRSTHAGKFVDVNPAMVKMFGYSSKEEMLEMDIKSELYFDPKERGTHIIDTGHGETDIYRLRRKDGTEIWVEDRGIYTYDEQGSIVFHEGMMRDVTERIQAQNALAASEAELRALFTSMQDVVLVIDRDGVYRKIAPTNPSLLVKPAAELLGKNLRDVFPAEQVETFLGMLQQVLDTKQTTRIKYELLIGDRTVWFETSISPMDIDSTLWVARDVTERVRAEEALRASEERFHTLYDNATIGLYRTTPDGRILMLNPAGVRMLGYASFEEIAERDLENPKFQADAPRKDFREKLEREGTIFGLERKMIKKDGSVIFVRESAKVSRDENGKILYYDGSFEDITEHKRAELNIHQRVAELEMLYQSGLALSQLLTPKEIGQKILELLAEKLGWHQTRIRLYHPQDDSLELLDFNQPGLKGVMERGEMVERFKTIITRSSQGMSGWAIQIGEPVRSGDVSSDPHYIESTPGIRSGLYVPMKLGDRIVGVIGIEDEHPDAFSAADERLIATLANQAASAFENARLFEVARQRVMELETINRISLILRTVSKQEEMLSIVLDEALAILNTSHGCIEIYNKVTERLDKTITRGWVAQMTEPLVNRSDEITEQIFAIGEIYTSREFVSDPRMPVASRKQIPPSWGGICLPIRTAQQTLGVLFVSVPSERELDSNEIRLLGTLSEMTGAALQRIQLYDETTRRAQELTTLQATVLDISSHHPLLELLNLIVERAANLLGASGGGLYLTEPEHRRVRCLISYKTKQDFTNTLLDYGVGAAGYVAETGKPIIIDDYGKWSGRAGAYENGQPFDAVMSAPLLWQNKVTGVIHVLRDSASQKFTQDELNLLLLFANHAAVAVENARLLDSTQQHVGELTALHRASQTLLAARLDPEHIYQAVHQAVAQTMPCEAFVIVLDSEDGGDYQAVYFFDKGERFAPEYLPRGSGLSGHVISLGETLLVDDLQTENDLPMNHFGSQDFVRSVLAVPLRKGDEIIGMLSTQSYQPHAFSEAQRTLLETISAQLASAIDNAFLYQQTQARLKELEAMHNVSNLLRTAQTVDEALPILLDQTLAALETDSGSILLYDPASDDLQDTVARGWFKDLQSTPIKAGEGVAGTVFATGQVYSSQEFVRDTLPHTLTRNQIPAGWGGACLPIRTGSEIAGVLFVSVHLPRLITPGQLKLLNSLAEIAGATLHRMKLYDETARRAQEFATLYEMSNSISAESELNAILHSIVEHARTLLNAASSGIYLYDKEHQEVELAVYTASYVPIGIRQGLGEGVAGRVAQTRQPLRIDNYSTWEGRSSKFAGTPFRGILDVPMLYEGDLIGVLLVDEVGDSERKFTEADERLLSLFASQAAGAIHSARLHEETTHRLEHLQALRAIDQAIAGSVDMQLTLSILLTHTISQLHVDAADVLLLQAGSNLLELVSERGFHSLLFESISLDNSFAGRAVREHYPIMALDFESANQNPQFGKLWKDEGFVRYWCVPLIVKGELKGILEVYCRIDFTPNAEWLEFLEALAGQAAIAIDNTQLFENLQRANQDLNLAYDATIEGWSRAMDLRDHETEGHTIRVTDLTVKLARAMHVSESQMTVIRRGALLHDMGKLGVPDSILYKKGDLTTEEWAIMRKHPQLAREMLVPIAYLNDVLDIPYCHHEKWDGTGYPQGLKGEQIPLFARIFAVVDVWDALTNDRPYRAKWKKQKARQYIQEKSGEYFDPQVVDIFLKYIEKS